MRKITTRFVLLVATAAILPLVVYGMVSINSLRQGTEQSVHSGNASVARRAAEQIQQYIDNNIKVLQSVAAELEDTRLQPWQQDRVMKNYVLKFPEFREITLFDAAGAPTATSRLGQTTLSVPAEAAAGISPYLAPVTIDDDLLPKTSIAIRVLQLGQPAGWLIADLSLEELWRMVDRIRVGNRGFALLVTRAGQLIAHGDPDQKERVARGENLSAHPLIRRLHSGGRPGPQLYRDASGEEVLSVVASVEPFGWAVLVEEPTAEAYQVARRLERQLLIAIALALFATIAVGYLWGRSFIRPIFALMRGTRAIAEGRLQERVKLKGRDEFRLLGDAFDGMADKLVELQENVRKQERQAMFGRVAAGLVHDLSHPIQNIGNSCKLILKMFDDAEYRETFRRTIEREFHAIKRVLEDLRNLARPIPLERFPVDLNRSVSDVVEAMQSLAEIAGVTLETQLAAEVLYIEGDVFGLGRVYRNLIMNALQATAPGGRVTLSTSRAGARARVAVADTGCGIPPERLGAIFDDFVTTKRRGLGLGLAISRKIVEQLDGTISATSETGRGTTFVLEFPTTTARPMAAAVAS
jgi:signal transduction histidine kinase